MKAYVWDHVTHMTCDVVDPEGPLRQPGPPATERLMAPAVDWVLTALPQQVRDVPEMAGALRLVLLGPGGRSVHLTVRGGRFAVSERAADPPAAVVTSSTDDLLRWATRRRSWRELDVAVTGDRDSVSAALDVIRVF